MDDQTFPNKSIGFTFTFDSTAYTSIGVSANGYIIMGSGTVITNYTILNGPQNDVISAFCADLLSHASTGRLSYLTSGAPPIRIMTIQWTDFGFYPSSSDSSHCNFQIKLFENSNIVQFVYGSCIPSSTVHNVQVGLRGASPTDVSSRTTTTNWLATTPGISTSPCRFQTGVTPPSGLTFQWAPPGVVPYLCESFNSSNFPPNGWSVTATGTTYLSRSPVSAFCLGTGSLKIDFYDWVNGTQSFTSPIFPPVYSYNGCDSLSFSYAKAGHVSSTDVMQIQTSTDGGASWAELIILSTQLNTAPAQTSAFTPSCTQWGQKSFALPDGTNRIRFNYTTANDNNLYLDSICILCLTGIHNGNNNESVISVYAVRQNYPNPFNPTTVINYQLPFSSNVKLTVYDVMGREVRTLVNEKQNAGSYNVEFDGTNLASGVYFYNLSANTPAGGKFTETKKMLLIK